MADPDLAGYQMLVTSVREGRAGTPFHGGVDLELSTKVIVVVDTSVEPEEPDA